MNAPIFSADLLLLYASGTLWAYDVNGQARWTCELPRARLGPVAAAAGMVVACWSIWRDTRDWEGDAPPPDESLSRVVGIDAAGAIAWRAELASRASLAFAHAQRVYIVATNDAAQGLLHIISPMSGLIVSAPLPWGANHLAAYGSGLLATSRWGGGERPGLYTLTHTGAFARAILHEPVYDVHVGDALVTVVTAGPNKLCRVSIRDAATLDERWATLASDFYVAVAGDLLVHIAEDNRHVVVGRDSATGNIRWQSAPTDMRVGTITLADGYVFVRTIDGITILDPATGMPVAPLGPGAQVAAHAGRIYIADDDLQCFAPA